FLANWFRDAGLKVGLLSRGYKSLTHDTNPKRERGAEDRSPSLTLRVSDANDEKLLLDQFCPGVPHWQNPDRCASAKQAVGEGGCELLILDDGFQHRGLHRDLDIVLIDALNPWGYGHCLPRGLLREPVRAIGRADLVLMTRADLATTDELTAIRTVLARHQHVGSVIDVSFQPTALINSAVQTRPLTDLAGQRCLGFCGVGNPESFEQTLRRLGADVVEFHAFPDHHHYSDGDLALLAERAATTSANWLLTTRKDLVKLPSMDIGCRPLWAVDIGTQILRGAHLLEHRMWMVLESARRGGHD
ncbi:MAG TPA: tetraacyldisaccharide 4'-kinase, partial [Planctomycetaceae bacterium]|nr:tetraacyldisaccharide 4'-kinase [Planctomycetaceae bacterium]